MRELELWASPEPTFARIEYDRIRDQSAETGLDARAEGDAERLSISLQAIPSFEAFGRYLESANPFLFWMRVAQTAWAPWLGSAPASLLSGNDGYLPATPKITGPNAARDSNRPG